MGKHGHWTPRYIYDRLGLMIYECAHPHAPWLVSTIVDYLEGRLKPGDRGIEWGSGRSTVWFAQRVERLVSVEHKPYWYARISAELARQGLRNVEYHFCAEERGYCAVADHFPPESFDFCLVDGLARDRCALSALSLVKPGGIVIVDNCNRYFPTRTRAPFSRTAEQGPYSELWTSYLERVEGWSRICETNGVSDTGVWVKPADLRAESTPQHVGARAATASLGYSERFFAPPEFASQSSGHDEIGSREASRKKSLTLRIHSKAGGK